MPRDITVTFEDGSTHVYRQAPDNVTPEQVTQRASKEFGKGVSALDGGRASVKAGQTIRDIPRQVGLTARYGLEGLGQAAEIVTEPLRRIVVNPILGAMGKAPAASTGRAASSLADTMGLPSPVNADERVVGDAARLLASGGGMMGVARGVAGATQGVTRAVASQMAAQPVIQSAGAVGAGLAGGSVREAGGGPMEQFAAALAGGIAGGVGAAKTADLAKRGAAAVKSAMVPRADRITQADGVIELAAQRSGIDWQSLAPDVRNTLRGEVADALSTGRPLDAKALQRLMVFRSTGTTPTVGMLTQNPVAITREKNLAKMAANLGDENLQKLPMLENQNTARLLQNLDEAGAANAPSLPETGKRAIDALSGNIARTKEGINTLYQAARDSSGRSLPLEGGTFTRRATELLDEAMAGGALPKDVQNRLNAIAAGEYPLTVASAEDLKRVIGQLQRGSNEGSTRYALGLVRQALDETPLQNAARQQAPIANPNNLPAVRGSANVPALQGQASSATDAGEQAILAFNKARSANRAFMQRLESNPALQAVADGVEPDQFIQRYVLSKSASAKDVRALKDELNPESVQSLRQSLVSYLKGKATSDTDDIARFNNQTYRNALRDIGDDKLAALFTPQERQMLKDVGEAGKYMQAQPAGSAVNNSNSGALLAARGLEMLDKIAGFVPLGGREIIRGKITQPLIQRSVMNPQNALLEAAKIPKTPVRVNPLLAAVAPVEARENERR
jgi:hypothetical protein